MSFDSPLPDWEEEYEDDEDDFDEEDDDGWEDDQCFECGEIGKSCVCEEEIYE